MQDPLPENKTVPGGGAGSIAAGEGPVLLARAVGLGFPGCPILDGWSADLPAGLTLVLGDEGTGKTSILRLLAGLLRPSPGSLRLHGCEHGSQDYQQQVFWRDPRDPWPREWTPATWGAALAARHPRWRDVEWRRHVDGFALQPHLDKAMFQLSTGSQRKVLLAAALASGAPLTLIDEPTAALDRGSIAYLTAALEREARTPPWTGRAIVVAHYDTLGPGVPWQCTLTLGA